MSVSLFLKHLFFTKKNNELLEQIRKNDICILKNSVYTLTEIMYSMILF